MSDREREQFEAWACEQGHRNFTKDATGQGYHLNDGLDADWMAWRAGWDKAAAIWKERCDSAEAVVCEYLSSSKSPLGSLYALERANSSASAHFVKYKNARHDAAS